MAKLKIKTASSITPMIYAYSTPEVPKHNGWVKIGYTDRQTVEDRIAQQTHIADIEAKLEWKGTAIYDDGSMELFHDTDFHSYLTKLKVERTQGTEWFHLDGPTSQGHFYNFKRNRGVIATAGVSPYILRDSQKEAVAMTLSYFNGKENAEFLWNAKPRFGKTLGVYDLCKQIETKYPIKKILIVTNRPAIANSWYEDYVRFMGDESGFKFVSEVDSLKRKAHCLSRQQFLKSKFASKYGIIEFVSLQDLKGSLHFGGTLDKLEEVANLEWDLLVVDEAHEGVDTDKSDVAFDQIKRKYTLHLSGTPFKALATEKFKEEAIYNWTYADERRAKEAWNYDKGSNPYEDLPRLNLFTYQMSEIIREQLVQGIEIKGETSEYAFDLNEFFSVNGIGEFVYEDAVDNFLDALTTQEKYPFSTLELREELKHTFWLLNRVDSAKALAKKLNDHNIFKEYKIVVAAGDGRLSEDEGIKRAFETVNQAIATNDKTITLSVGQLTTGVTIPQWSAVLMLLNLKSPSLYMQAAFRAQNPYIFKENGSFFRKENAYVFDFDPARTLTIYEKFANDLCSDSASRSGDIDARKEHIRELLNFFPVIGEDDEGKMVELDAEQVLSIPRKIRSKEVVRRGFMSDFLFQNIANVFRAPQEVIDILNMLEPQKEPAKKLESPKPENPITVDEEGNIVLSDHYVIGKSADVFGDKIFAEVTAQTKAAINDAINTPLSVQDNQLNKIKEAFKINTVDAVMSAAKESYGDVMKASTQKKLTKKLTNEAEVAVGKVYGRFTIETSKLEKELKEAKEKASSERELTDAQDNYEKGVKAANQKMDKELSELVTAFAKQAGTETVRAVETQKKEEEKKSIEGRIKDHLRGFSRTIPSFLMAYGNEEVILQNFDTVIPDEVFLDVTSITLDQFRFLRDGGPYTDPETGKEEFFAGHLFDPVVFDDSVKEFLQLREELSDYFNLAHEEDIFNYIPPQKTNQIYTPKDIVKKMVDMLEEEQPGCFDNPNKTFIDLYMKSGLYVAEIVKRLYRSKKMAELFPSGEDRLKHIFKHQVYGLAPTEIIYQIALHFVLGFNNKINITEHNLKQLDVLPFVKEGGLEQKLDELFGDTIRP